MVYLPPSNALVVGTNRINATSAINLIFVFLSKNNIILGDYAISRPRGAASTFSGSLG